MSYDMPVSVLKKAANDAGATAVGVSAPPEIKAFLYNEIGSVLRDIAIVHGAKSKIVSSKDLHAVLKRRGDQFYG